MKDSTVKTIGWIITAFSLATSLVGAIFGNIRQDTKIEAAVAKALADKPQ